MITDFLFDNPGTSLMIYIAVWFAVSYFIVAPTIIYLTKE